MKKRKSFVWTPEDDARIGRSSDRLVAEALCIPVYLVRRRRLELGAASTIVGWTPAMVALMGKMPDAEVVTRLNLPVTASAVAAQRQQRGIPSFNNTRKKLEWAQEWLDKLGNVPDVDIAVALGIHKDTVAAKRRMVGRACYIHR